MSVYKPTIHTVIDDIIKQGNLATFSKNFQQKILMAPITVFCVMQLITYIFNVLCWFNNYKHPSSSYDSKRWLLLNSKFNGNCHNIIIEMHVENVILHVSFLIKVSYTKKYFLFNQQHIYINSSRMVWYVSINFGIWPIFRF